MLWIRVTAQVRKMSSKFVLNTFNGIYILFVMRRPQNAVIFQYRLDIYIHCTRNGSKREEEQTTGWKSALLHRATINNTNTIQNQFVMRRLVQAKNRNRRRERRLLLGVISVRGVKEFAFKITFKTIDTMLVQCKCAIPTTALGRSNTVDWLKVTETRSLISSVWLVSSFTNWKHDWLS